VNSREIEAAADAWLHRKDVGPWDRTAEAAFEHWINESPRHRVAYLRLESAWDRAERLTALRRPDGEVPVKGSLFCAADRAAGSAGVLESPECLVGCTEREPEDLSVVSVSPVEGSTRRVHVGRRAIAASIVLIAMAAAFWWTQPRGMTYSTAVGAVELVPIADGSTVTLNTATKVHIALTEKSRSIDLERGEALFEVAKDPHRPFVVLAGHKWIVAVGTKFSVRRDGDDVQVVVTEGTVRIEGDRGTSAVHRELAHAGTIARARDGDVVLTPVSLSTAEDSLSWRRGILVFRDTKLQEAVAELNRYNDVQIRIDDEAAGRLSIAGEVRSTNVNTFVRLVERAYHLHADREGGVIVLRPLRHDEGT